jgi:cysteine desulfurase
LGYLFIIHQNVLLFKVMKKQGQSQKDRVFLDYASVTPVDLEVEKEMLRIQKKFWANPSSLHTEGEEAKNVLDESRIKIARILHCKASEIFFTSGGTESLNLAIFGVVAGSQSRGSQGRTLRMPQGSALTTLAFTPHIIVSTIEHPAILEPIKHLLKIKEIEVSFISPDKNGRINPESIKRELKENTVLVAIQHANNEIGVVQPIREISKIKGGAYLLVDACQSVLYEDVSLERLGADILVLDGLKMYGPRGTGILAKKSGVNISPLVFGGGQESGFRPGTENVVGATGLAKALEIAVKKRDKESSRLTKLRDYVISKILEIPNSSLNGSLENRLPNNINICFKHPRGSGSVDSEFLVIKLDTRGFAVSAASACHTLSLENGSYVIEAVGKSECSGSSLRITLGRDTKKSDIDRFVVALKKIVC